MENQDLDLIGQTAGNMPYKIGIVDKDGKLKNQFVAKASTNRIDIPQSSLGTGGGSYGLPSVINLFSGSAVGDILLLGLTPNYSNVQDGLLLTLSNITSPDNSNDNNRIDLSSIGLKPIKIPKELLTVGNSFDISDQLSQYIGKTVKGQYYDPQSKEWHDYSGIYTILSFENTTIKVLPNTTLNMNLTMHVKTKYYTQLKNPFPIPVIKVNDYKN